MAALHSLRSYDEVVLAMLRLRSSGWKWQRIADRFGKSVGSVQRTCKAVMKADEAHCGKHVRRFY